MSLKIKLKTCLLE